MVLTERLLLKDGVLVGDVMALWEGDNVEDKDRVGEGDADLLLTGAPRLADAKVDGDNIGDLEMRVAEGLTELL